MLSNKTWNKIMNNSKFESMKVNNEYTIENVKIQTQWLEKFNFWATHALLAHILTGVTCMSQHVLNITLNMECMSCPM